MTVADNLLADLAFAEAAKIADYFASNATGEMQLQAERIAYAIRTKIGEPEAVRRVMEDAARVLALEKDVKIRQTILDTLFEHYPKIYAIVSQAVHEAARTKEAASTGKKEEDHE